MTMRLSELDPEWIRVDGRWKHAGVSFLCPHCKKTRVGVLFLNLPCGSAPLPDRPDIIFNNFGNRWARSGLGFDDLTLSPSIDSIDHWKGQIVDGQVLSESSP